MLAAGQWFHAYNCWNTALNSGLWLGNSCNINTIPDTGIKCWDDAYKVRWFAGRKNAKIQFCEWAEQRAGWDSLVCSRTVSQTDWKCDLPLVKKSVPSKNNQNHIIKIISKSGARPRVCKLAVKSRRSWLCLTAGRGGIRSCAANTRQKEVQSLVLCTGIPFTFRAQSVHCTEQTAD